MLHPSPPRRELALKLLLIALSKKAPSIWVTPSRAEPCRRTQPCSLGARHQAHHGNDGEKCKDSKEGGDIPEGGREGGETTPKTHPLEISTPWFARVERSREVTGACFGCATSEGEKDLVLSQKIGICNKDNA